jgi:predicted ATP-grasp superfamily ATP-dependent carboligase
MAAKDVSVKVTRVKCQQLTCHHGELYVCYVSYYRSDDLKTDEQCTCNEERDLHLGDERMHDDSGIGHHLMPVQRE